MPAAADPLAAWIAERFGAGPVARGAVSGGCIHEAAGLELEDGRRLFVKTNHAEALPMLEAEAEGLAALAACADAAELVVPAPLALGLAGDRAVLVLPWLDLGRGGGSAGGGWAACGAALARLHRRSLAAATVEDDRIGAFGWPRDNFIGASPQHNGWEEDWPGFFSERRLRPQLEALSQRGARLRQADSLPARAAVLLESHRPDPCLVHGDLWRGNAALAGDGRGVLIDPAVHRADREVDLAMARLFGGFPQAFYDGYQREWPLPDGYRRRVDLYNLYHLLNHANLFGGGYLAQAQAVIDRFP
jgi:fructosamine-3-kinase